MQRLSEGEVIYKLTIRKRNGDESHNDYEAENDEQFNDMVDRIRGAVKLGHDAVLEPV
jgi:hypothetical protein